MKEKPYILLSEKELNQTCSFEKCDSLGVCKKLGMCRYKHHDQIVQGHPPKEDKK